MRTFIFTHDGHYPVGACSLVLAPTQPEAEALLRRELAQRGIPGTSVSLVDTPLLVAGSEEPKVIVILDGNY